MHMTVVVGLVHAGMSLQSFQRDYLPEIRAEQIGRRISDERLLRVAFR